MVLIDAYWNSNRETGIKIHGHRMKKLIEHNENSQFGFCCPEGYPGDGFCLAKPVIMLYEKGPTSWASREQWADGISFRLPEKV